jgi:hypothetical protein
VDLDERPLEVSESRTWDFSDLKALFRPFCFIIRAEGASQYTARHLGWGVPQK